MGDRVHQRYFLYCAKTFQVMVFLSLFAIVTSGCNGVPGDGTGFDAQQQQQPASSPDAAAAKVAGKYISTTTPGSASYLIGPQDVLDITVFKAPDLSRTVPVADDGNINLPLIGATPAAGKSPSALEKEIQKRLDAGYMRSPQVTVVVKEYNSQRVTLEGAVKNPGVFSLKGNDTLEQAIAKAGGVDRATSSDSVVIFRTAGGSRTMIRYDLSGIRSGTAEDPPVQPGDVIVVEDSTAKTSLNLVLKVLPVAGYAVPFI
ncbi:polysaccharide biosynthesis/export family protein [Methylocystis echinoides]|jgi:polysaccharide export outer membrane protein|uniref:polysaccharide biosynthesis/export family protein n=1 Tax=Methylocystis echinoides TaxID=29468 RepID=UPI003440407F